MSNDSRIMRRSSNMAKVEVLPFHKMGEPKWEALKLPYALKDTVPPSPELVAQVKEYSSVTG